MTLFKAEGKSLIEALLLCSAEPLTAKSISEITQLDQTEVCDLILELQSDYQKQGRGFTIREIAGGWIFATLPQHTAYIEKLVKPRLSTLSQAALEVLAIVAYRQPVTRAEIEEIRGVSCDSPLGTLLDRHLIEEKGRKDVPGRPIIFGTTQEFLKCFGLVSLEQLPKVAPSNTENQESIVSII
jgi:segregation and condensation protein B